MVSDFEKGGWLSLMTVTYATPRVHIEQNFWCKIK